VVEITENGVRLRIIQVLAEPDDIAAQRQDGFGQLNKVKPNTSPAIGQGKRQMVSFLCDENQRDRQI